MVQERKDELSSCENISPPEIIFGDEPLPVETEVGETLKGTPTSKGYYQGPVKVVRGLQDFGKLEKGDVLVIPYSDVSWTPLFVHAGAVIAESGGLLSHSSIVAREYGIPAVVSVPRVCEIADYTLVSVDGFRGQVSIHDARL